MDEVNENHENGWKERLRATVLDIRCGFFHYLSSSLSWQTE
jgi:hypothetical protein